jgi:hypothetical protein
MIQMNQRTRCNSFTVLLFNVYVWLNKFRATLRPSSGAYNCTRSLWFYRWRVAVGALLHVFSILMLIKCGHNSLSLHVLLNKMAAIVLCSFCLTFLYEWILPACSAAFVVTESA